MNQFTRPEFGAAALVTIGSRGSPPWCSPDATTPTAPEPPYYEASERDYRVVLVEDAMSNLDGRGVSEMAGIGVALMAASEVEDALGGC